MNAATYFVPYPGAFHAGDPRLATLIKVPLRTRPRSPHGNNATEWDDFLKEFILIDLREFPDMLDTERAIKDCELVSELLKSHSSEIQELIASVKASALRRSEVARVNEILSRIGFTETIFVERGGGFLWLLTVLLAAGCGHVLPYANRKIPLP